MRTTTDDIHDCMVLLAQISKRAEATRALTRDIRNVLWTAALVWLLLYGQALDRAVYKLFGW